MNKHVLGRSSEDRPSAANYCTEVGHWEGNLIKGKWGASKPAIRTR